MKLYELKAFRNWDEAAREVERQILEGCAIETLPHKRTYQHCSTEELEKLIVSEFEVIVQSIFHSDQKVNEVVFEKAFLNIATCAMVGYALESKISTQEGGKRMVQTVIGKQRMYGHGNISRFGIPGIAIRLNDKLERLKNLQKHDGPVLFEPLQDTWLDICGYSVIAIMWINGWFMLNLDEASI